MSTTAGGFPLMAQTQSSRYLTYNELAWAVDVLQRGVIDRDLATPPGAPSEGDAYIVASGGTGAWSGEDDSIAFYFGGVWNFLEPDLSQGRGIYIQDENTYVRWNPDLSPPAFESAGGVTYTRGAAWSNGGDALVAAEANVVYVNCHTAGTITRAIVLGQGGPGDAQVDVWNDTLANYPPTDADSITAAAPLVLTSVTNLEETTFSGWDTAVAAGDILAFKLDAASTFTFLQVELEITT